MSDFNPVLQDCVPLLIEPLDTLLFRDARPFDPADTARSILPTPQTLAGMLRTHAMQVLDVPPTKLHRLRAGANGASPRQRIAAHLAVMGPWFCKAKAGAAEVEDLYLPIPATIVQHGKGTGAALGRMLPDSTSPAMEGWSAKDNPCRELLPLAPEKRVHLPQGAGTEREGPPREVEGARWMGSVALGKFLRGACPERDELFDSGELFVPEERTSLVVQPDSLTAEPGAIFSVSFLRLQRRVAFYAELGVEAHAPKEVSDAAVSALKELIPETGVVLPFGGEGRRVRVRRIAKRWAWPTTPNEMQGAQGFFTLLIAPAIYYQRNGNANRHLWQPGPPIAALRAAAVPRPIPVSGFGLEGNDAINRSGGREKPVRYAVPPGAVYFWQNGKSEQAAQRSIPQLLQLSESPQDRAAGWGIALKGVWK